MRILLKGGPFDGHQVDWADGVSDYTDHSSSEQAVYRGKGEIDEATGLPVFDFVKLTTRPQSESSGHA